MAAVRTESQAYRYYALLHRTEEAALLQMDRILFPAGVACLVVAIYTWATAGTHAAFASVFAVGILWVHLRHRIRGVFKAEKDHAMRGERPL